MAMTKAEMEEHRENYYERWGEARSALKDGLYHKAVELAVASWEYLDGMMQYERRYEQMEFTSIESIDLVLAYAPLLFDSESLDALESLLKNCRRIEKNTSDDLADKLTQARRRMWDAHRLWNQVEQHSDVRQDTLRQILGGDQGEWRRITETWEQMGLVRRTPRGKSCLLELVTRLGEVVSGKCSSCGRIAEAPKAMFLEQLTCPECGLRSPFVILASRARVATED